MYESVFLIQKIISYIKPKRILELGVESGCSYYHIAQVFQGELIGIDCWCPIEGYPYNAKHFDTFQKMHESLNKASCKYIRGYFEDVVPKMLGKFDIVLYDGSHIENQTQKHYELFEKKLKNNGLILIHDINSPKCDENKWWWNISIQHPSYSFGGRFGLGVLAPKGIENLEILFKNNVIRHIRKNDTIILNPNEKPRSERRQKITKS